MTYLSSLLEVIYHQLPSGPYPWPLPSTCGNDPILLAKVLITLEGHDGILFLEIIYIPLSSDAGKR